MSIRTTVNRNAVNDTLRLLKGATKKNPLSFGDIFNNTRCSSFNAAEQRLWRAVREGYANQVGGKGSGSGLFYPTRKLRSLRVS